LLVSIESNDEVKGPPFPVNQMEINLLYSPYRIQQMGHKVIKDIPNHLIQKGYIHMVEVIYLISQK
jgi:hypothetical protein